MYYTYVLHCHNVDQKPVLYTGYTDDLVSRLKKHKSGKVFTTAKYASVDLVYYEASKNKRDAVAREKQLKTGFGRSYLKRRLQNYNAGLV